MRIRKNEKLNYNGGWRIISFRMAFSVFSTPELPRTHKMTCGKRLWEIQDEEHICGPVAVINALHHFGRYVGTATRRSIIKRLNTLPQHENGFEGTKPEDFEKGLVGYFSQEVGCQKKIIKFIGETECSNVFDNKKYKEFIILFAWEKSGTNYGYHYIFGWRDKHNYIITLNDGCDYQKIFYYVNDAKKTYCLNKTDKQGNKYPQIWVLY